MSKYYDMFMSLISDRSCVGPTVAHAVPGDTGNGSIAFGRDTVNSVNRSPTVSGLPRNTNTTMLTSITTIRKLVPHLG